MTRGAPTLATGRANRVIVEGMAADSEPLFSFLHLSDLHAGHGDDSHRWDQSVVVGKLVEDAGRLVSQGKVPRPDAILVTGDIAFSGATLNRPPVSDEYATARAALDRLAEAVGLTPARVYCVPGNHDVQRRVEQADVDVLRLLRLLRGGEEQLDAALGRSGDRERLLRRLANYSAFAAPLAAVHPLGPDDADAALAKAGCYTATLSGRGGRVRIIGLNSSLLAADDQDRGRLRLGKRLLGRAFPSPPAADELVLTLLHHPLGEGWLADEREALALLTQGSHIVLCGHVHEADAAMVARGGGRDLVTLRAGAAHGESGEIESHGYAFAAVYPGDDGARLRLWPRRWSSRHRDFRHDVDNAPPDHSFAEIPIARLRAVPRSVPPVTSSQQVSPLALEEGEAEVYTHEGQLLVRRAEERTARALLASPSAALLIWGRERCGKTWFLRALLHQLSHEEGAATALIDLAELPIPHSIPHAIPQPGPSATAAAPSANERPALEAFTKALAVRLVTSVGGDPALIEPLWAEPLGPITKLGKLLRQKVLTRVPQRLVLALDRIDLLHGWRFENEILDALRAWVVDDAEPLGRLRLILSLSGEPASLHRRGDASPLFNVITQIRLHDFTPAQVEALARGYGHDPRHAAALMGLCGGSPFLIDRAMQAAARSGLRLRELLHDPEALESTFGAHLSDCESLVRGEPALLRGVCSALTRPAEPLPPPVYERLYRANLLRREDGHYRVPYRLYHERMSRLCSGVDCDPGGIT